MPPKKNPSAASPAAKKAPAAGKAKKAVVKKTKTATVTKKGSATKKKPASPPAAAAAKAAIKKKSKPAADAEKKSAPKATAAKKKSAAGDAPSKKKAATPKMPAASAAGAAAVPKKSVKTSTAEAGGSKKSGVLEVGTDAPEFTVNDQNGSEVSSASFKGEKNVVVFFYPKDNTPGCTKEACSFRDLKDEYDALDCVVLGVSADHETSHGKFVAKFNLNFSLLADTNRALINAYGAGKAGDKIQRSTVLIDKQGKVAAVWNPVNGAEKHPNEVLAKLKEIS